MKKSSIWIPALLICLSLALLALAGCSEDAGEDAAVSDDPPVAEQVLLPITLATIPVDDMLPFWVADYEGIFDELGLEVTIETFGSGMDMMAAVTAGEAQGASISVLSAVQLSQGGTPFRAAMRLAPSRGAIVTSPESGITEVAQLAGVPIAASDASLEEYIIYRALTGAGVSEDEIVLEAIPDLRMRPQMLMNEQIQATAIPWTLASVLGQDGANIVVSERDVEPWTSTVLGISEEWLEQPGADETVVALWQAWDRAIELINADPESYFDLLVERANIPDASVEDYDMQVYAPAQLPDETQVTDIITWAYRNDYIQENTPYEDFIFKTPY